MINPGFGSKVKAYMINPFVKFQGFEFLGVAEKAQGRRATETENRDVTQYAAEGLSRFLGHHSTSAAIQHGHGGAPGDDERRHRGPHAVRRRLVHYAGRAPEGRVRQPEVQRLPITDIRNGGKFKGWMVEGVVAF